MKLMDIQDSDESGESWAVWKDRSVWGAVTRGMTSADVCFFLPRATRSKCKNRSLFPSLKFLFSFFSEIVASIIPEKTKEQNQGWTAYICIYRKLANCQSYSKSRWNISNIIFPIWDPNSFFFLFFSLPDRMSFLRKINEKVSEQKVPCLDAKMS